MKIAVVGASGYAGVELMRLLAAHPEAEVVAVTGRQDKGKTFTEIFPAFSGVANYDRLVFEDPEGGDWADRAEIFFTATPHGAAMKMARRLLERGRLIDLSADFRLRDPECFKEWYEAHQAPELLKEAVYGLPELYAEDIKKARLLANPGCYPTSVILGLAPFMKAGLWDGSPVIADSKSGVSGAGRGASQGTSFCEVQDGFKAYKITGHRHTPEMEQELSRLAGAPVGVAFTPHLLPINRGILSTIYVRPREKTDAENLWGLYQDFYRDKPFVRVRPKGFESNTAETRGSNFCDIAIHFDTRSGLIKIVSVIDNLCRGAAGQALVNMNLMFGLPEGEGLAAPLKP